MILFIGDSFTWGQGLQYYHLVQNQEWCKKNCDDFLCDTNRFEYLGFEADEFRRKHSFPYLVSKELDTSFQTPRFENGGNNIDNRKLIHTIGNNITKGNISLIVFQFSCPTRQIHHDVIPNNPHPTIDEKIYYQVESIDNLCKEMGVPWLGFSWMPEIGDILKNDYTKNYIPVFFNNQEYSNFYAANGDSTIRNYFIQWNDGLIDFTLGDSIQDGHFNLLGHKSISNSIIKKIKSDDSLKNLFWKYNKHGKQIPTL